MENDYGIRGRILKEYFNDRVLKQIKGEVLIRMNIQNSHEIYTELVSQQYLKTISEIRAKQNPNITNDSLMTELQNKYADKEWDFSREIRSEEEEQFGVDRTENSSMEKMMWGGIGESEWVTS